MKSLFAALLALTVCGGASAVDGGSFDCVQANDLRGLVSFLASDLLQGRDTPSPGLDAAADYIASEFRRAGLDSPVGLNYFQVAPFDRVTDRGESFQFTFAGPKKNFASVSPEHISFLTFQTTHLTNEPVFKWTPQTKVSGSLAGKVLVMEMAQDRGTVRKLELAHPDAIVLIVNKPGGDGWRSDLLVPDDTVRRDSPAIISVPAVDIEAAFQKLSSGLTNARVNLNMVAPILQEVELRNVVGVLHGADQTLAAQAILITAHYDHLGVAESGQDRVFNGADDNASGVATVIELASAFAHLHNRPKRTLVFMCFFGEEKGLLGSQYYVDHTLFPLTDTIADINFEQMGIPEPKAGLPKGSLGVTGYELSELPASMSAAVETSGVKLVRTKRNLEYFSRSDNFAFAQAGVPAHTFVAAFEFPQYHRVSDEWRNLDYDNMAQIVRGIGAGILSLANSSDAPHWSETPQAKPYQSAWRALHP